MMNREQDGRSRCLAAQCRYHTVSVVTITNRIILEWPRSINIRVYLKFGNAHRHINHHNAVDKKLDEEQILYLDMLHVLSLQRPPKENDEIPDPSHTVYYTCQIR